MWRGLGAEEAVPKDTHRSMGSEDRTKAIQQRKENLDNRK